MSTVEDRLAAIIAEQMRTDGWTCEYHEPTSREGECSGCDESLTRTARAVAAVIASSDDLAVIELPKPNEREDDDTATTWGEAYNDLQVGVHDEYADQVQVWVDYVPIEPWGPREAVEFASHLLAAAKAAEGVSDR